MIKFLLSLLCRIGLHYRIGGMELLPSPEALIVEEIITHYECKRCKKVLYHSHWYWNDGNAYQEGDNSEQKR